MNNQLISAMTGLTGKKQATKAVTAPAKISAADLTNALQYGQTAITAALHLANALHTSRKANVASPAPAAPKKAKRRPSKQGTALSGRGWHPAQIEDGPEIFQGTGDTV